MKAFILKHEQQFQKHVTHYNYFMNEVFINNNAIKLLCYKYRQNTF